MNVSAFVLDVAQGFARKKTERLKEPETTRTIFSPSSPTSTMMLTIPLCIPPHAEPEVSYECFSSNVLQRAEKDASVVSNDFFDPTYPERFCKCEDTSVTGSHGPGQARTRTLPTHSPPGLFSSIPKTCLR